MQHAGQPSPNAPPGGAAIPPARVAGRLLRDLAMGGSTPARLRLALTITALLAVVFAFVGALGIDRRDAALDDTASAAQQLIDVQSVQVALVRADALASENYLRGGTEDPTTRASYVEELTAASRGLVAVGNRVPSAEAGRLADVSSQLGDYAGLVEQARANNRQGYPVGAAYLRNANSRAVEMVSALRDVETSIRNQANDGLDRAEGAGWLLHLVGWPLVLLIAAGGAWMSRRFRRLVNVPLAAAGLVVLGLLVAGGGSASSAMSDAEAAVVGPLQSADLAAQARSAAFDAHTQEFFTLINRGNAAANEAKWDTARTKADEALALLCGRAETCLLADDFAGYAAAYDEVRALDNDAGDWDAAVELSLGESAASFAVFDESSRELATRQTEIAITRLEQSSSRLPALRVAVFLAGLSAAALAAVGYGQRLREYR